MRRLLIIFVAMFALATVFMFEAGVGQKQAEALAGLGTPNSNPTAVHQPDATATPAPVTPQVSQPSPPSSPTPVSTPSPTPTPSPSPTPIPVTPTPTPKPKPKPTTTSAAATSATPAGSLDAKWQQAMKLEDGAQVGVISADSLNVRSQPKLNAPVVATVYGKHPVEISQEVTGDAVDGQTTWFRIGDNQYISAAYVEPFTAPAPPSPHNGHWVDINLSSFYLIAYDGSTPTHVAIIIVGKEDHATPTGEFTILRRVPDETMDAATVGVPKSSPDYYYLPHVLWTQYFTNEGHALHTNYWSQPWQYGTTGSHGCINLQEPDAHYLWDFLKLGSPVRIHY